TTFGQTWDNIHQDSKPALKAFVDRHAPPWVWTSGVQVVLDQWTWVVLGALGTVLVVLGRKKARRIGYGRDWHRPSGTRRPLPAPLDRIILRLRVKRRTWRSRC